MNKKIYFLPLAFLCLMLTLASCDQSNSTVNKYDNWQARNQAVLDSLQSVIDSKSDPNLFVVTPMSNTKLKIYAEKVTGYDATGGRPLDSDTVQVYYRGKLINGEVFDKKFSGINPNVDFEPSFKTAVNGSVITGWTEVLRLMKKGERWVVYIPYQLGFKETGSGAIPGYSTLIFDMYLYNYWSPTGK